MSFIGAVRGRYGDILYWNRDIAIASGIAAYGEYFESEVEIFRRYVKQGDAVIDCGANIGAHTIALASLVGPIGIVLAIEPQRPLFQIMCANAILNGYMNVFPAFAAVGKVPTYKRFLEPDYHQPNSFGGYETSRRAEVESGPATRIEPLDRLWRSTFERRVSFIKIDVEGAEREVVQSAENLLRRDRPILYIENDRRAGSEDLIKTLRSCEYDLYWHIAHFYNPNNLAGRPDDMPIHRYGWVGGKINGASLMLLCLPTEKKFAPPADMRAVGEASEYPPFDEAAK